MDTSGSLPKRRKVDNDQSSPTSTPAQSMRVKQEDPESPPLPQRRVIRSGSRRYLIPADCVKGEPNFKTNRQNWSKKEADILRSRGFKPIRMFIREDGMVIDWQSAVPVWSDTLEPAGTDLASVIQRAHAANDQSKSPESGTSRSGQPISPGIEQKQVPRPPRPSSAARVARVSASNAKGISLPSPTSSPHGHDHTQRPSESKVSVETPRTPPRAQTLADTGGLSPTDHEENELHTAAIEFLRQYIKAFDEDRSDLASAYSRNAVFSYRVHELAPVTSPAPSKADTFASKIGSRDTSGSHQGRGVKQSRLEIVTALLLLGSSYRFCAEGVATVTYDFAYLDPTNDVLLVCYAKIVDTHQGHQLSLDQSFILRRKEHDEEDRLSEGLWPLVAVSHQMTIRDLSQHSPQKAEGTKG